MFSFAFRFTCRNVQVFSSEPVQTKVSANSIPAGAYVWEVDEFFGVNEGLILAEIELPSEDAVFEKPDWIGEEVSGDARYFNSSLVANPYSVWKK